MLVHFSVMIFFNSKYIIICAYRSMVDVISTLTNNLDWEMFPMIIRRGHVCEDALKRVAKSSFHPSKRLEVIIII